MAFNALAASGGAAEGLDTYLAQMLAQQKEDEAKRRNLAEEDYKNRALAETTALRRDLGTQAAQARADALKTKTDAATVGDITALGPTPDLGAQGPATRTRGIAAGMDPTMFTQTPGAQVQQYGGVGSTIDATTGQAPPPPQANPGSDAAQGASFLKSADPTSPMNAPSKIGLRGTWAQSEKEKADTIAAGAANDKSAQLYEMLTEKAQQLELAGKSEESKAALRVAQIALASSEAQLKAAQTAKATGPEEVKPSEGTARVLRSVNTAAPLIDQVMGDIKRDHPDIEDAAGNVNPKYNTVNNSLQNNWEYAKYRLGFEDGNSPRIQLMKLLQPVQAGQFLQGSRSYQMVELALTHLADPKQTIARQWEALKQLKAILPEMRTAAIHSQAPVSVDKSGNPVGAEYGNAPAAPAGAGAPAETPEQRIDRLKKLAGIQ
jgi:hypothetical protein